MRSEFRKKLEEMFNKNMEDETPAEEKDDAYRTLTTVRNVCFIPKDGNAIFLNYAFLVSGEYDGDNSTIILSFTTHSITIKGHGLESTFFAFMEQIPRKVSVNEDRYVAISEESEFAIREIEIQKMQS